MRLGRLFHRREQRLLVRPRDSRPELERHVLADHRRHPQQPLHLVVQPRQSARRSPAAAARARGFPSGRPESIPPHGAQGALRLERPQQFAEEEGIALRASVEIGRQSRGIPFRERITGITRARMSAASMRRRSMRAACASRTRRAGVGERMAACQFILARSLSALPLLPDSCHVSGSDELTRRRPLSHLLPRPRARGGRRRASTCAASSAADIRALVDARYPLPETGCRALGRPISYGRAEGNPLFSLGELLRTLEAERALRPDAGGMDRGRPGGYLRARAAAAGDRRAGRARLDDAVQRLLGVAAVIGQDVPLDSLGGRLRGADEGALLTAGGTGDRGASGDGIAGTGRGCSPRHALIREALYEGIILTRRRVWHRRIAEATGGVGATRTRTRSPPLSAGG